MSRFAFLQKLRQRYRRARLARSEERHWRRRIILAGRKIHAVQLALGEDLADARGVKARLDDIGPRLERLEDVLTAAHGHIEALESGLEARGDERELIEELEARLSAVQAERDELRAGASAGEHAPAAELEQLEEKVRVAERERAEALEREYRTHAEDAERIAFLEGRLRDVDGERLELVEIERRLRGELELLKAEGFGDPEVRALELDRASGQFEARIDELTDLIQELRVPLAEDSPPIESAKSEPTPHDEPRPLPELPASVEFTRPDEADTSEARARIAELEVALRDAEIRRLDEEGRHTRAITELADHSRARVAELEGAAREASALRARLTTVEAERDALVESARELALCRQLVADEPEAPLTRLLDLMRAEEPNETSPSEGLASSLPDADDSAPAH